MRKTNPLTKLRFKLQVSAAFASVSILIDADPIRPKEAGGGGVSQCSESLAERFCDKQRFFPPQETDLILVTLPQT
jgi:hypothetical protein